MSSTARMGHAGTLLLLLPLAVQADPEVHHHHLLVTRTHSIFSCAACDAIPDPQLLYGSILVLTLHCLSQVVLSCDGPVVLDAPILFTGELRGGDRDPEREYRWRWFDTASPGHYKEVETNGTVANTSYQIVYTSKEYDAATYEMTLTIYVFEYFYWKEVGKAQVEFT